MEGKKKSGRQQQRHFQQSLERRAGSHRWKQTGPSFGGGGTSPAESPGQEGPLVARLPLCGSEFQASVPWVKRATCMLTCFSRMW